jgi:3-deoxy-7-phosphoheptulonate synthase
MDENIVSYEKLTIPQEVIDKIPLTFKQQEFIKNSRETIKNIINKKDDRLLLIIGPCSIHDIKASIEYATRLKSIQEKYPKIFFVMRVYFEKPRTLLGWKGLLQEPYLDGKYNLNDGIFICRGVLSSITDIEIPIATEMIETITPQYISDYISWTAIGARTVESPLHRYLASGLSFPVGFKNTTAGDITPALNACIVAKHSHSFIGINVKGELCHVITAGNNNAHIILRGGNGLPNHTKAGEINEDIFIMVDCSHGNSNKDHLNQKKVIEDIEVSITSKKVGGIMIESFIEEGRQDEPVVYGKSITDKCVSWEQTVDILDVLHEFL